MKAHTYTYAIYALTLAPVISEAFAPTTTFRVRHETGVFAKERIMSDMDIMCIANAADLCTLYEECDLEEREALLNRFEEQSEVLAERLAMMQALSKHLQTGDHLDDEQEIRKSQADILAAARGSPPAESASIDFLEGKEVSQLNEEIMTAIQEERDADGVGVLQEEFLEQDKFLSAIIEDKDDGHFFDAWLGF